MKNPFRSTVEKSSDQYGKSLDEFDDNIPCEENDSSNDVLISIICGSIAGVVAKTAVAPAER